MATIQTMVDNTKWGDEYFYGAYGDSLIINYAVDQNYEFDHGWFKGAPRAYTVIDSWEPYPEGTYKADYAYVAYTYAGTHYPLYTIKNNFLKPGVFKFYKAKYIINVINRKYDEQAMGWIYVTISATYKVELLYNANGGYNTPAAQTFTKFVAGGDAELIDCAVSSQIPIRDGYNFLGWSYDASATSASVNPGQAIQLNGRYLTTPQVTLYAVWQKNSSTTNLSVKSGGSWVKPNKIYAKSGGAWHEVKEVHCKSGGSWHKV